MSFISAGVDFLAKKNVVGAINQADFEQTCGIGVEITPEEIEECVSIKYKCSTLSLLLYVLLKSVNTCDVFAYTSVAVHYFYCFKSRHKYINYITLEVVTLVCVTQ